MLGIDHSDGQCTNFFTRKMLWIRTMGLIWPANSLLMYIAMRVCAQSHWQKSYGSFLVCIFLMLRCMANVSSTHMWFLEVTNNLVECSHIKVLQLFCWSMTPFYYWDMRLGVLESVPIGEPCMVICAKRNGTPRRTIDFQPLNLHTKRTTLLHGAWFTLPFHQAWSVPQGKKTIFDACNGYHSVPLHPGDWHYITFITPCRVLGAATDITQPHKAMNTSEDTRLHPPPPTI